MSELAMQGRAGRLLLLSRLSTTRRGAELLDRKRQLLQADLAELASAREEAGKCFEATCSAAEEWSRRAALLGGQSDLSLAADSLEGRAEIEISWRNSMGVALPDRFTCSLPSLNPLQLAALNAAMGPAAAACRAALEAAVAYAIADEAYRRVNEELAATRRRARAIEKYRLPALEAALCSVEQRLDELDRDERVVARWSRSRTVQ